MTDEISPLPEQDNFIRRGPDEHALLAAGPGTGKTWVLERRSEYLVEHGVDPASIALVTLTNAMAASLRERIAHGEASTFHSFSLKHLNRLGDAWGKNVASPWEQRRIIPDDLKLGYGTAFPEETCTLKEVRDFLRRMGENFSRNQAEPPDLSSKEQRLLQVLHGHRQIFGYALFDELVYDLSQLIAIGEQLNDAPAVMLVDEYQDLTAGELRLLQMLAETHGTRINACGDDRQSIYGFRAADPLALHRFAAAYDIDDIDSLFRSRRLPAAMCTLANAIASALPAIPGLGRPELHPWDDDRPPGIVTIVSAKSLKAEHEWVGRRIAALFSRGRSPSEIMVVAATNRDAVLDGLKTYAEPLTDVPFISGRPGAPDPAVEEILVESVVRLTRDIAHQMAWRSLVEACPGFADGRKEKVLAAAGVDFAARLRSVAPNDTTVARVVRSADLIEAATPVDSRWTPTELRELCVDVANTLGYEINIARLLLALPDEEDEAHEEVAEPDAAVPVIEVHTIHSSKGLEAPIVFLVGAITEAFTGRTNPGDGIRQLFVGVTRASEELAISAPRFVQGTAFGNKIQQRQVKLSDLVINAAGVAGFSVESM